MNTKLTNILLIILLIFNVFILSTWWVGRKKSHHPKMQAKLETTALLNDREKGEVFLVKTLGFDSIQQKKLDGILKTHFDLLNKYMGTYIRNQSKLFEALKDPKDTTSAFIWADSLGVLKVAMEKEFYTHFISIRNICNNAQLKQFDNLIDNISQEFAFHHDFRNSGKTNHDSL